MMATRSARSPVVLSDGMGVDSTGMLIGLRDRGIIPDLILFANTVDEKQVTYDYVPIRQKWLADNGFPPLTIVQNMRPRSGDGSLSDACLRTKVLPALAYGRHQCSMVWKIVPQEKFVKTWAPAVEAWRDGLTVTKLIGYDAGPRDSARCAAALGKDSPGYTNRFPLVEWGWDRERCVEAIIAEGLPVPAKSACFHCPASTKAEILWLRDNEPEKYERALHMERNAADKLLRVKGLGRKFSWADI
jgi:hypothetical protein